MALEFIVNEKPTKSVNLIICQVEDEITKIFGAEAAAICDSN